MGGGEQRCEAEMGARGDSVLVRRSEEGGYLGGRSVYLR